MRYLSTIIIALFSSLLTEAQTYEIGLYGGGTNFIGDVGKSNYIAPNAPFIGGIAKWNRSPRHAFRASVVFANLEAADDASDDPRRQQRDYEFNSTFVEASLGIEYTFWDYDLHNSFTKPATPYLYTGFTYFYHDVFRLDTSEDELVNIGSEGNFAIPMVVGFKALVTNSIIVAAELGARYTFTNNLDGSYLGDGESSSFGNINNNDWYMFTGLTVTYTFGRQPCYCGF
ncbi:type IX secretion system protein PorG [Leeuwenhoekiella aequorea]|uniref:DUF6089 domain-containing protein n=1 Tax=Leeuwenhoekiella aequorea TaxID=283736 RepID=A0A4V1KRF1_9FLAO|nr:DUF6089 family protein [Leeuwenhoekiella aequorea]RXG24692.1 hypothetical protein DSM00_484 [Leeuwenhoekiella aequorea]